MAFLSLEIEGLDTVQKYFRKLPKIIDKETQIASKKAINTVEGMAVKEAPSDRGFLRSKRTKKSDEHGGFVRFNAPYATYVHDGTRPHFPPIIRGKGLEVWARRKSINVWAVAKSISRRGTKKNPFLERAVDRSKFKVDFFFEKALKNTVKAIKK